MQGLGGLNSPFGPLPAQILSKSSFCRGALTKPGAEGHNEKATQSSTCARMAELADALASGASSRKGVEVRVLFRAP
jgi:hypothetical protein